MKPKTKTNYSFSERNKKTFSGSFRGSKKEKEFNILWLFLIALIVILILPITLIFSNFFNIKSIKIHGLFKIDQIEIENIVLEQKNNKKLFIKQENLVFFNKNNLTKSLEKYNFKNVYIEKKLLKRSLNINIEERTQSFIFFESNIYFFVDSEGYIIDHSYNCNYIEELKNKIKPVIIESNSSSTEENITIDEIDNTVKNEEYRQIIAENSNNCLILDENYKKENLYPIIENIGKNKVSDDQKRIKLDQEYIDFTIKLYNDIDISGDFGLKNVILDEEYNTVKIRLNNDLEVYFSFKNEYSDQISRFFVLKKELGEDLNDKKYIDLRYGDKIFYY
jgi:cell division septal protein FtsQ